MTVQLAMYKGPGHAFNALTRFWTGSEYPHCELRHKSGRLVRVLLMGYRKCNLLTQLSGPFSLHTRGARRRSEPKFAAAGQGVRKSHGGGKRMKTVFVLVLAGLMTGCTVAQSAQYATARYCVLPPEVRAANREVVAFAVAPNQIRITCSNTAEAGDVQD